MLLSNEKEWPVDSPNNEAASSEHYSEWGQKANQKRLRTVGFKWPSHRGGDQGSGGEKTVWGGHWEDSMGDGISLFLDCGRSHQAICVTEPHRTIYKEKSACISWQHPQSSVGQLIATMSISWCSSWLHGATGGKWGMQELSALFLKLLCGSKIISKVFKIAPI